MKDFLLGSFVGGMALLMNGYSPDMKGAMIFFASGCLALLACNYVQYVLYWRRKRQELRAFEGVGAGGATASPAAG